MVGISIHNVAEMTVKSYRKVSDKRDTGNYYVLTLELINSEGNSTEISIFSEHSYDWKTGETIEINDLQGFQEYPEMEGDY